MRADLGDVGVYIFSNTALKLVNLLRSTLDVDWHSIGQDIIPFIAKNQFKEKLSKMADEIATRESKHAKKNPEYRMIKETANRLECLLSG
jgi:hypothetical protein